MRAPAVNVSSQAASFLDNVNADPEHRPTKGLILAAIIGDEVPDLTALIERHSDDLAQIRYERGLTVLHVATDHGSNSIARHLLSEHPDTVKELINARDDTGRTPLVCALLNPENDPDLLPLLQLDEAQNSYALARVLQQDDVSAEIKGKAVQRLTKSGVNITQALDVAVEHQWRTAIRLLTVLGAPSSEVLSAAAIAGDRKKVQALSSEPSIVAAALVKLASANQSDGLTLLCAPDIGPAHARVVAHAFCHIAEDFRSDAPSTMPGTMAKLVQCITHTMYPEFARIAALGNIDAIKILAEAKALFALKIEKIICDGNLAAMRTLVAAGATVPIETQENLLALYTNAPPGTPQLRAAWQNYKLLYAVEADISNMPQHVREKISREIATLRAHPSAQLDKALINVINLKEVAQVKTLIDRGAKWENALTALNSGDMTGVQVLLHAGVDATQALCYAVRNRLMAVATALIEADARYVRHLDAAPYVSHPIVARVIIDLIQKKDDAFMQWFIPTLSNGTNELVYAARMKHVPLAQTLINLRVNGSAALIHALATGEYEAAGQLISWGYADVDTALMLSFRLEQPQIQAPVQCILQSLGGHLSIALLRAAESWQIDAAKNLIARHPEIGRSALMELTGDDWSVLKLLRLRVVVNSGADTKTVIADLIRNGMTVSNKRRLQRLADVGVTEAQEALAGHFLTL
ncbi:ankyrin repeat domain-containing protein [Bordetella sp. 15P40C-2]|uniref:ankyrin repeat domain-containing protein n=1 Tax=Bordetella sp. 15P40C-2 TaxID=2572246 RepID=UPI0013294DF9|nr:ankyrin repeat domain-containing protein [Bordetella sp. 15P40C-2]MVW70193.1 hypothetical protein [Bordetella sp. 15P40C-2]